jgi:aldose 1-epimerase
VDGAVSAHLVQLEVGDVAAVVDPAAGGRLTSLIVGMRELLVQHGDDVFHWGSFPMAPWVGRLRRGRLEIDGAVVQFPVNKPPHALHGLVTDRTWTVTRADGRSVELALQLGVPGADPWPWRCLVTQQLSLTADRIDFRLTVSAEQPMPADIGWHPWFVRQLPGPRTPVSIELDVPAGLIYLDDAEGIPTGELGPPPARPWDHCFVGFARPPVVRWPGVLELTVDSDCRHWVLYDREEAGICVEPWTGPPNSLNGPARTLVAPGDPLEATMSWAWRRLSH